jgi:hypothetical protein
MARQGKWGHFDPRVADVGDAAALTLPFPALKQFLADGEFHDAPSSLAKLAAVPDATNARTVTSGDFDGCAKNNSDA